MRRCMLLVVAGLCICLPAISQAVTWEVLNTGTQKHIRDLYFVNSFVGYAVGDDSLLIKTTDAGDTWTALPFPGATHPIGNLGNMSAVAFTSVTEGMLTYTFTQEVLGTTNGGTSWSGVAGLPGALCSPARMIFDGPGEGYMVGRGCFGGAYISTYGPGGWSSAILTYYGPSQEGLTSVTKDPVNDVVMTVGPDGFVARATDLSFADFDTIVIPDTSDLTSIDYAGNNTYYISTSDQFQDIYMSTDGGLTFHFDSSYMFTFYYPEVSELDFVHPDWGVAAGVGLGAGLIMHKKGDNWIYTPTDFKLNAVHVVDSTLAFVAGDSGKIYRYQLFPDMGIEPGTVAKPVQVYPNPVGAGEMIRFDIPAGNEVSMAELCDLQGRTLAQLKLSMNGTSVSATLPEVPAGMYLLRTFSGTTSFTSRVMVK